MTFNIHPTRKQKSNRTTKSSQETKKNVCESNKDITNFVKCKKKGFSEKNIQRHQRNTARGLHINRLKFAVRQSRDR